MSLGDSFPEDFRQEFACRSLETGSVLRLFVRDTNPPKIKRFIIVGRSLDGICLATVYINTHVNHRVNWSPELKAMQILLEAHRREYLEHDSYVDCSKLIVRKVSEIKEILSRKPETIIGKLNLQEINIIKQSIMDSKTIKGKDKKKFSLFLNKS